MFFFNLVPPDYIPGDGVIHYLFQWVVAIGLWFRELVVFREVFGLENITMFDCLTSGTIAAAISNLFMPWVPVDPSDFDKHDFSESE